MVRKKLAIAGLVAVAALALSASSAMAWNPSGNYTFDGQLTSEVQVPGLPSLTCDVEFDATLNAGTGNTGTVDDSTIVNCTTTVPNCAVAVTADTTPAWSVAGSNTGGGDGPVIIRNVIFQANYSDSGGDCAVVVNPATSCSFTANGAVTGAYSDDTGILDFNQAPGLFVASNSGCAVPAGTEIQLDGFVEEVTGTDPSLE
jgi:hypothetical protein